MDCVPDALKRLPEMRDPVEQVQLAGLFARVVPRKMLFVPSNSQFFTKADAHEQAHVDHFQMGNIFGNVFQPADFFARIRNFTDTTREGLVAQIAGEFRRYSMEQQQILANGLAMSERLAFQVSDLIAPRYLYQNCGRF